MAHALVGIKWLKTKPPESQGDHLIVQGTKISWTVKYLSKKGRTFLK